MEEKEIREGEFSKIAATENESGQAVSSEIPQIPNEELAKLINAWFVNIRNILKVIKEKDANLYKMNNELQLYRNDYSRQLFKSLAQNLINFREDCAKSLRDAEEYEFKKESVIKYIGYVADEFGTLLENIGIEISDGVIKLNGQEITSEPSEVKIFQLPEPQNVSENAEVAPIEEPFTQQMVMELLEKRTEEIKAILRDNSILDTVVGEYIKQSQLIERSEQQIVLYPVIRELANYYGKIRAEVAEVTADADVELSVLVVAYKDILGKVINKLEDVLAMCQVTVEHALADGDVYDPKRHRIMKFIPVTSEQEADNGKIVKVYTDLYKIDDKVLYPAKVDVYKVK